MPILLIPKLVCAVVVFCFGWTNQWGLRAVFTEGKFKRLGSLGNLHGYGLEDVAAEAGPATRVRVTDEGMEATWVEDGEEITLVFVNGRCRRIDRDGGTPSRADEIKKSGA